MNSRKDCKKLELCTFFSPSTETVQERKKNVAVSVKKKRNKVRKKNPPMSGSDILMPSEIP